MKQINAGVLDIGYAEAGPGEGPAVGVCLGGFRVGSADYAELDGSNSYSGIAQKARRSWLILLRHLVHPNGLK
jgi:hypothetical protein